jgi:hypothetical protein
MSPKATDIIAQGAMSEANETLRSMPSTTRSLKASNIRSLKASNLQRAAGGASLSETDSLFRSVVGFYPTLYCQSPLATKTVLRKVSQYLFGIAES